MGQRSIGAYDLRERVARYDADMEVMHPNRRKMVQVALGVLPFPRTSPLLALDLGVGTGYFSAQFLQQFPSSRVVAVDGAETMVEFARVRLRSLAARVVYRVGDFRNLASLVSDVHAVDVVFSSYALHHLGRVEKEAVVRQAVGLLRPGGWFLNADVIIADSAEIERRIQEIRVAGIVERAAGADERFRDAASTRRFLDELEAREGDQPLTLRDDLAILRRAGLCSPSVFWLEYREMVYGGIARWFTEAGSDRAG
ncbi:MAG TPA: class I SAM-dependent methyltransferase [Thermoleophilia bacterium]|nr:class I SAM-dependent methyltransferase [Thermoleophilia bacterium]